jgi:hypothetical protein
MSDSPFADNGNAVLTFQRSTDQFQEDEDTGDMIPVVSTVEILAKMRMPKLNPSWLSQPGADRAESIVSFRAVDPMYLPAFIRVGSNARCQLTDLHTGNQSFGDFRVTEIFQSAFSQVTEALGTRLEGSLRIDGAGGPSG